MDQMLSRPPGVSERAFYRIAKDLQFARESEYKFFSPLAAQVANNLIKALKVDEYILLCMKLALDKWCALAQANPADLPPPPPPSAPGTGGVADEEEAQKEAGEGQEEIHEEVEGVDDGEDEYVDDGEQQEVEGEDDGEDDGEDEYENQSN